MAFFRGKKCKGWQHPFSSIKQWMNQGAFLMRGVEKVRSEFSLTALAFRIGPYSNTAEDRTKFNRAEGLCTIFR